MTTIKAADLQQTLRNFEPRKALSNDVELREWYVPRPRSPRQRLRSLLESRTEFGDPQKLLLVGHLGNGKSTEINKLSAELDASYRTVDIDVLETTGRTALRYEDLMLTLSSRVTQYCIEHDLIPQPVSEPVRQGLKGLHDWWLRLVAGVNSEPPAADASTGIKLKTLLGELELGVKHSAETREGVQARLRGQIPELIRHLDWVVEHAEAGRAKRLLVVVEGLDKVDLESARGIFRDHAPTITAPNVTMIFTFPLALRYSDDFGSISRSFTKYQFLPNFCSHFRGKPDLEGQEMLRKLVEARMDERLIAPEAMDLLVAMSGGIPLGLVKLVRDAALYALERTAEQITHEDVAQAVRELRYEVMAPLKREDYDVLEKRHQDHRLTNDESEMRLLYNGSLIEYPNESLWCDAHPVLWQVLENNEDGGDERSG